MPKMLAVEIRGLYASGITRLGEIMRAGLAARAPTQTPAQIRADQKLVDYILSKLETATREEG